MNAMLTAAGVGVCLFLAAVRPVLGQQGTYEQRQWSSTVYYRATFVAPQAGGCSLYVAAVDQYEAYLNGVLVSADSVGTRLRGTAVGVAAGENHLAVCVTNRGTGAGNGLLAALVADTATLAASTVDESATRWRWTGQAQEGTAWTTARWTALGDWEPVQHGSLELAPVGTRSVNGEVIAGFPGGADVGTVAGGIALRDVRGENVARGQLCTQPKATDGDLETSWDLPERALNAEAQIDLGRRRTIHTVRVLTRGSTPQEHYDNSLKGYRVEVGEERYQWTRVGQARDITSYDRTVVHFAPRWARFVRILVVDVDEVRRPRVAEIQVYGDHYPRRGTYRSPLLDLGAPDAPKNLGTVTWAADTPAGTSISLLFRTGNVASDFALPEAGWSGAASEHQVEFPGEEPVRLLQYRVDLLSGDELLTPTFRGLQVAYDTQDIAAHQARGWIVPNRVPTGRDTTFTYYLDLDFEPTDRGVERIVLEVPELARLHPITGPGPAAVAAWTSTRTQLEIRLDPVLRQAGVLAIPFTTRTYVGRHDFRARLYAAGSQQALNVGESRQRDPLTGAPLSWSVAATALGSRVLTQVQARPAVFTPNGDQVNDRTVIEFALARLSAPRPVRLGFYDLAGRRVRELSLGELRAGAYLLDAEMGAGPGSWDGTDEAGERVPPGLYLYRLEVDLDSGVEAQAGLVGVAY
ncbi:MAG: discoidin domain-containing protein [Candidatus Latescibacterota bacterium]